MGCFTGCFKCLLLQESPTVLPPTPTDLPPAHGHSRDVSSPGITEIPETPSKAVITSVRNSKRPRQAYTYEVHNGWIHCRFMAIQS